MQPRSHSWPNSFISTTYFKRLPYLLSWAPQNQCNPSLPHWSCYKNSNFHVCTIEVGLLQCSSFWLPKTPSWQASKSSKQCCLAHLPVFQIQSCHTSFPYPTLAPNWKKGLISKLLHFALNLWMVLPLPTSQTFFIFTLFLGSSFHLQTPECSEYHTFAQSQVVSTFSCTKLQQHGTNSLLLSISF